MIKVKLILMVIFCLALVKTSMADDHKKELQKYINEIVNDVKQAETPAEKREILNDLFSRLQKAFYAAKNSTYIPASD
ncbi:MAG TPA: hypothetical protein VMT35_18420, partial [Ignavibacteriaceae bacterium]|nr:hypothetical protein [Ignavibacteriaceae bacterium]